METHCDDATCSVSAEVSMRAYVGEREKGRRRRGGKAHCISPILLVYCIAAGNLCPFSQILIIVFWRSCTGLCYETLTFALNSDNKVFLIFAFTENHPGLEHQINASCLALCFAL